MMAAVSKPFSYFLGETQPTPPKSGFRKPDEIHGTTGGARPIGSASIPGEEGIPIERSSPEMQNSEPSHRNITSAYLSFDGDLHLQTDSEYERNQQTANSSNNQLKSAKAPPYEMTVPAVPPKRPNDQTERRPAENCGQLKERPNPDDSDNGQHLYGQVKRHKESKTEREDMTFKRTPYEIPPPFSYTEPIRPAAPLLLHHGERRQTSVDENGHLEFDDVVIDDFSDLCSSLSSIDDSNGGHRLFDSSSPPVAPSKPESREEVFTSDDSSKRPKLQETFDASSLMNSRKTSIPNSMAAAASAKPFTYLTGEIPPSKSEFLRSGEIDGTPSSSLGVNPSPRPIRNPSTLEKDADLTSQRMVPKVQHNELSHRDGISTYQPVNVVLHPKTDYYEQKAASDYAINQQKTNDLQDQLKIATTAHAKKVPVVPPKRSNDQTEERPAEEDSSDFVLFTSRQSLFGDWQNNGQVDRSESDGRGSDYLDNSELLYRQVNRHLRDVKTDKDSTSSSAAAHEIPPPPFSYTEPFRPAANDKGKKSEFEGGAVIDFDDLRPSSPPSTDVQTLFDNFILVKATSPEKTRQKEEITSKKPTKRLKLEELFDPPPPSLIDRRKVSILGVTSTESSDFHIDPKPKIANGKNYDRVKTVSTFDDPDYKIIPCSTDGTSEAPVQVSTQRRCCDSRLCIAILVTALVTSVICLGAGFVAGWFGRGMRDFGQP